ncbi:MAG: molecular chaperone [Candidatus Bathyarchaeia archaeon]
MALVRSLRSCVPKDEDNLRAEYTRLFVKGECSPYETSYAQRPYAEIHDRGDVAGFYRAFGLKPSKEHPDHLVSELEFMGLLCLKEANAVAHNMVEEADVCKEAQKKFLSEHLTPWMQPLENKVKERSKLQVYPVLLELIRRFVILDRETLNASGG